MVKEDYLQYIVFFDKNKKYFKNIEKIFLLSPSIEQELLFKNLFKTAKIFSLQQSDWDLNFEYSDDADLIFLANILMYSNNPSLWIKNLKKSSKYIVFQDLINRKRGIDEELGPDQDKIRYSYKNHKSFFNKSYNLDPHDKDILEFDVYTDYERVNSKHFICLMKGDK